ncbi:hypothetical protein V1504DRAFT_435235 [Lipomyces starkeyi]
MSEMSAALHNEVITTKIYDPTTLGNAPILPALAAMLNSSFAAHFAPFMSPAFLNGPQPKVYYNDKFWEDWGDARRLKLKQWKEENKDAVHTQWEITAVAVRYSPRYVKKGLATHVVTVVAEELKRRLLASHKQTDGELKTMVRVIKEINGDYWLKKGFVLVEETMIPAGISGNLTEWTNWDMAKTLRLDDYYSRLHRLLGQLDCRMHSEYRSEKHHAMLWSGGVLSVTPVTMNWREKLDKTLYTLANPIVWSIHTANASTKRPHETLDEQDPNTRTHSTYKYKHMDEWP